VAYCACSHAVVEIRPDGSTNPDKPLGLGFDCQFIFDFLEANSGCGWLDIKGGADPYVLFDAEPFVPEDREIIEVDCLQGEGWKPVVDRFSDGERYVVRHSPPLLLKYLVTGIRDRVRMPYATAQFDVLVSFMCMSLSVPERHMCRGLSLSLSVSLSLCYLRF
jgi:hypothetical protein